MANRSIVVTLRANVSDFKSQFDAASRAAEQTAKSTESSAKQAETAMGRMVQSAQNNRQAWDTAGATLTAFGAATLGGLGLATKAAMDWESAWAGVQKTVDGSAEEMAALESGLRGMARELPASHQEIAAVAEAAGQLGIQTPNILGFTKTMIDLGESTNLSAEQAATALARFSNITGTSQANVGRLGASIVGLGNNFATTESEIVDMSMRLAGAGQQANLSEGEILGMATAMSSVGIEAEAGGTAMSTTMKRIGKAVEEGGDSLDLFAQVSGMTAQEFTNAWQESPAEALTAFVEGLAKTEQMGMSTNAVLTELGITGIRESDALLRLSSASGVLADAMATGNAEFEKGTALIEEASKRYETAESRIAMARNALVDAGISIGGVVLPAVASLADGVADLAGFFADLPGPVQGAAAGLAGVVGAGSLAAGSFLLLFPRVIDTVQAFRTLQAANPGVASGLGKVGKAAAIAAASIAALNVAGRVSEGFRDNAEGAELFAAQLLNLSRTGDISTEAINSLASSTVPFGVSVRGVGDALDLIDTDPISAGVEGLTKALFGVPTTVDVATESLQSLDGALVSLVNGGFLDEFSTSFAEAVKDAEAYGYTAEDLIAQMPGLREALTPIATQMGLQADNATLAKLALEGLDPAVLSAAQGMDQMAAGADGATESVDAQVEALLELQAALQGTADGLLGVRGSARDFEAAMDAATAAAEENGRNLDITTEKGRANQEALDGVATATHEYAAAQAEAGASAEELDGIMSRGRESFIETAEAMGMARGDAEALADQLGLMPEYVPMTIELAIDEAMAKGEELGNALSSLTASIGVTADTTPAEDDVAALNAAVDASGGTVNINGNVVPADQALTSIMGHINNSDGTVTIEGETYPADQALAAAVNAINKSGGTVRIQGNNAPAKSSADSAAGYANGKTGTIDVRANTSGARSAINAAAAPRYATIWVTARQLGASVASFANSVSRASGGPVFGPGTGTSDSVNAHLSNGEHVLTANEVSLAGGHNAIFRMREAILGGGLRFADGGGVQGGGYAPVPYMSAAQPARQQQSAPSTLTLDGAALGAIAQAVQTGASQARIAVGSRDAALLTQAGRSSSRAFGGAS